MSLDIQPYLAAIALSLDDLSDAERSDLLEDLEQHLTEVAAEGEGSLADRLGPPDVYAAELRVSAGLPPRAGSPEPLRRERLVAAAKRLLEAPVLRTARPFLSELRPGWWVLRGYLFAMVLDASFSPSDPGPIPTFGSSDFLAILVYVLPCIFLSVWIGRRSTDRETVRRAVLVANAAIIVLMLPTLASIDNAGEARFNAFLAQQDMFPDVLRHADGSPISNICAYDSKLRPIDKVLLYDQAGRPIDNVADEYGESRAPTAGGLANAYPREDQGSTEEMILLPPDLRSKSQAEGEPFACPTIERPKRTPIASSREP